MPTRDIQTELDQRTVAEAIVSLLSGRSQTNGVAEFEAASRRLDGDGLEYDLDPCWNHLFAAWATEPGPASMRLPGLLLTISLAVLVVLGFELLVFRGPTNREQPGRNDGLRWQALERHQTT